MTASLNIEKDFNGYTVKRLIGKGKSAFSYLAEKDKNLFVIKLMHNEENSFYKFSGNKLELEIEAYQKLTTITDKLPIIIEYNFDNNYLVKEFIDGEVCSALISADKLNESLFTQLIELAYKFESIGYNLDYFPSNFVVRNDELFYIDYELNQFTEEWSLRNWGIYYWLNTEGFKSFLQTNNPSFINEDILRGIPHKKDFEVKAKTMFENYRSQN